MITRNSFTAFTAIIILFAVAMSPQALNAQDNGILLNKLSIPDGLNGAKITVTENGEAASIIRMAASSRRNGSISVYRVRIFFDNSQNARAEAYGTLNRFKDLYPDVPGDLRYDAPYFRVTAGYCLTKEEAIILWGRIKDTFPKAFLIPEPEDVSLDTFISFSGGVPETVEEIESGN